MVFHKMIEKRQFGIHTHMWNSTEDPSQIRFGGINNDLIRDGHDLIYFNTRNNATWEIDIAHGGLHENLFANESMPALINPGYPFIAMPYKAFSKFKQGMEAAYPDEAMTCNTDTWCYFFTPCEELADKIPDLHFTVRNREGENVKLRIPKKSFLYSDTDYKTNLETCHVGIIAQKYNKNMDFWMLG